MSTSPDSENPNISTLVRLATRSTNEAPSMRYIHIITK